MSFLVHMEMNGKGPDHEKENESDGYMDGVDDFNILGNNINVGYLPTHHRALHPSIHSQSQSSFAQSHSLSQYATYNSSHHQRKDSLDAALLSDNINMTWDLPDPTSSAVFDNTHKYDDYNDA